MAQSKLAEDVGCTMRTPEHPFGIFLEADGGHIAGVAIVAVQRLRVRTVHLKYLDIGIPRCRQVLFVCGDLELVHLPRPGGFSSMQVD